MSKEPEKMIGFGQIDLSDKKHRQDPDLSNLPVIPTRDLVLFPGVTFPITLGRSSSIATATAAEQSGIPVAIVCQTKPDNDTPAIPSDIYEYGVLADIVKIFELPDAPRTAIVRARNKIRVIGAGSEDHDGLSPRITAEIIKEPTPRKNDTEFNTLAQSVKEAAISIIKKAPDAPAELTFNIENCHVPTEIINLVATYSPFPSKIKIEMLALRHPKERGYRLMAEMARSEELFALTQQIHERTRANMNEQQKAAFLQQQMEVIRRELYGDDDDATALRKRAEDIHFPDDVREVFEREVDKLSRLNPQSPDYSIQYSYLDLLLTLPWNKIDPLSTNLHEAEEILNEDHYGLEKVKERVLEQLAVMMNTPEGRSPIICLVGAPGVGKTSLGKSIARALGRKYQRVSLGGLHDESEIRGHRRTYIGAMPGRIIDAMRRAGSSNPVLLLDEIDKMSQDIKGDPSSALLEVLDPEQNSKFHDNYVDVDYDLSKVLFIATANTLSTLQQPLLDRMEIIELSGYLQEEKIEIARRHLLPRKLEENNFTHEDISLTDDAIRSIIEGYTSESGVRQLEKRIASVVRKAVLKKVSGKEYPHLVEPDQIKDYLGVQPYMRDRYEGNNFPGVVTGLAWTAVGGEILFVESSISHGKGEKLTLTGNLGDVMKESAIIALQYVKTHAHELNIDPEIFDTHTLHIHVPEGAIPKDGPSAGITMATSIVSTLTRRKVRERIAMTGEITLRGKVLPVGGIKEKILAAKRAGIDTIILSEANRKDIEDIPSKYLDGMNFIYVETVMEVFEKALLDEKA
ncbi:MAG: endopeptidase La [Muribaculaceae bacterium]|nr:endopeptidase La [Muribaculaceae bacterium]